MHESIQNHAHLGKEMHKHSPVKSHGHLLEVAYVSKSVHDVSGDLTILHDISLSLIHI